jgi:hypothetical protein
MFGADNGRVFLSPLTVNHSSSSVLPEDFQIQPMATQNGFTSHAVRMFNQCKLLALGMLWRSSQWQQQQSRFFLSLT